MTKETQKEVKKEPTERELAWAQYVENYKKKNPVKWASKDANKEFDVIPPSFLRKAIERVVVKVK